MYSITTVIVVLLKIYLNSEFLILNQEFDLSLDLCFDISNDHGHWTGPAANLKLANFKILKSLFLQITLF